MFDNYATLTISKAGKHAPRFISQPVVEHAWSWAKILESPRDSRHRPDDRWARSGQDSSLLDTRIRTLETPDRYATLSESFWLVGSRVSPNERRSWTLVRVREEREPVAQALATLWARQEQHVRVNML